MIKLSKEWAKKNTNKYKNSSWKTKREFVFIPFFTKLIKNSFPPFDILT